MSSSPSSFEVVTIDHPVPGQPPAAAGAWEIPAIVLAGLTRAQRESLAARMVALRRVLEPDPDDGRPILQRNGDEAAALGVSRRTLQRQAAKLQELGSTDSAPSRADGGGWVDRLCYLAIGTGLETITGDLLAAADNAAQTRKRGFPSDRSRGLHANHAKSPQRPTAHLSSSAPSPRRRTWAGFSPF
jgi:hypothetical protein